MSARTGLGRALRPSIGGRLTNVCTSPECFSGNGRFPADVSNGYGGWHQDTPVDEWMAGVENPSGNYFEDPDYAANICNNNCAPVEAGERVPKLTGDRDGPTSWGVNARLARDPAVRWVEDPNGLGHLERDGIHLEDYEDTPRVVKVATFDPNDEEFNHPDDSGPLINGFAYFFLDEGPQNGFYDPADELEIKGILLGPAPGDGGTGGPLSRYLRLVE